MLWIFPRYCKPPPSLKWISTSSKVQFYLIRYKCFKQKHLQYLVVCVIYLIHSHVQVYLEYFFDTEDRHSTFSLRVKQTRGCVLPGFGWINFFASKQSITYFKGWAKCCFFLYVDKSLHQASLGMDRDCLVFTNPEISSFVPSDARCQSSSCLFCLLLLRHQLLCPPGGMGGRAGILHSRPRDLEWDIFIPPLFCQSWMSKNRISVRLCIVNPFI